MQTANNQLPSWAALLVNTILLLLFVAFIVKRDFPLGNLPVIGKYFRK